MKHAIIISKLENNATLFVIEGFKKKDVELDFLVRKIQEYYERLFTDVNVTVRKNGRIENFVVNYTDVNITETRNLTWYWIPSLNQN